MAALSGSFRIVYCFDVAEEIELDALRQTLGAEKAGREPTFRPPTPGYVGFERPPVGERVGALKNRAGQELQARLRYFDYGVVSLELEYPFELDWAELIDLSGRWIAGPEWEELAQATVKGLVERVRAALRKPYGEWSSEDYYIVELRDARDGQGVPLSAANLLAHHGEYLARIVRGEHQALSEAERHEVLSSSMSYSPMDLLVVGWTAAVVYDPQPDSAAPIVQLLEYANTQLLEFRHYNDVLTRVLKQVYAVMDRRAGLFWRWRLAGQAAELNTIRLDMTELTERTDNAIKFLSDMFYARVYRLAASKIGVLDYRRLVEQKLGTAGELYRSMVEEFHQGRAFVLELLVVIILMIELAFLFGGKR